MTNLDPHWAQLESVDDRLARQIQDPKNGLNIFFRKLCIKSQSRLAQLYDLNTVPKVFLHGNPHLDNLVVLGRRTGMVDFDRSRIGPYCWDIIRFLQGMDLRLKKKKPDWFLTDAILNAFFEGYVIGFESNDPSYYRIPSLLAVQEKEWQSDLTSYFTKGSKWAKKLRQNEIPNTDRSANKLLRSYFESRCETELLETRVIAQVGIAPGSLGADHYIFHLIDEQSKQSTNLIDIKATYTDPDSSHFYSHYVQRGVQMIEASRLYAPALELQLGAFRLKKVDYWGREIAIGKRKLSGLLNKTTMVEVALGVGSQLGRGHRRSSHFCAPEKILDDVERNVTTWIEIAHQLNEEIRTSHQLMIDSLSEAS